MRSGTILIADDDRSIRTVLDHALGREGHIVRLTDNASTLWSWIEAGEGDLVITDVVMPDANGLEMLPQIKKIRPELPVIVMSAQNTMITAIRATEGGAFEYLPKPFDLRELSTIVQRALEAPKKETASEHDASEETMPLVGRSPAMQDVYRVLARLMSTDLTVLVTGESGTGKELVARALHDYGMRKTGQFVALNMAAIPRELIESELFGHEKGAFTGAERKSLGRFGQAQGGTLFLDEIGDMPMEAQTRLLRVLQQGEYSTVGGRESIKTDVRIVAATHRDLRQLIHQGLFREDLYYRLNVVPLTLPSLRDRLSDIPDLARHFLSKCVAEGLPAKTIDPTALERMQTYSWPGNVRELENLIRRLVALYADDVISGESIQRELSNQPAVSLGNAAQLIDADSLSEAVERHLEVYFNMHNGDLPPDGLYERILQEVERPLLNICLRATRGNQIKAASLLGINRNTLRKKIRELEIPVTRGLR